MDLPHITLLTPTNGRVEYFTRAIASARENLIDQIAHAVIVVNSDAGQDFVEWVEQETRGLTPEVDVIESEPGFCKAIQAGWSHIAKLETDFVFHLEDDYEFAEKTDLSSLVAILTRHPELIQVSLKRQAWNSAEQAAGGLLEAWPDGLFVEHCDGEPAYIAHRVWFTTNPSLYRRSLLERGWPDGPNCEGIFTVSLWQDGEIYSAIFGKKDDPPRVIHIGEQRTGTGY